MTRNSKFAFLALAAFAVCVAAISARARQLNSQVATINMGQPDSSKPVKSKFEVLHMFENSIQVRSLANGLEIHTFVYSDGIRDNMQALFEQGGFQYGDKITIWHRPGADVALRIKGKPSKPL